MSVKASPLTSGVRKAVTTHWKPLFASLLLPFPSSTLPYPSPRSFSTFPFVPHSLPLPFPLLLYLPFRFPLLPYLPLRSPFPSPYPIPSSPTALHSLPPPPPLPTQPATLHSCSHYVEIMNTRPGFGTAPGLCSAWRSLQL